MNLAPRRKLPRNTEMLRDQITQRAYELYEQRGRQDGFAVQDWLQAEQELAGAEDLPPAKFLVRKTSEPGSPADFLSRGQALELEGARNKTLSHGR